MGRVLRPLVPDRDPAGSGLAGLSDSALTFAIVGASVVLFVWGRVPVAIVALGVALALWATGVLEFDQALAGFGDPTVLFIASLFVVSEGLDASGVTTWVGQGLVERAGESRTRLLVLLLGLVAVVTALINVNGAVAALMPVVVVMAIRLGRAPSKLLMPLAFGAHAGSLLALTGTPVNVLISEASADAGTGAIGFFEFGAVGLPLVVATIAVVVLFGERLLPERRPRSLPADLGAHAGRLAAQYSLDDAELMTRRTGVAEVVIPPRSELIGERAFAGMTTDSGELMVLAIQRGEEDLDRETTLRAGDTLLLQGSWRALETNLDDPDVLVVDTPDAVRRQAIPLGPGAKRALAVLAAMVVLLATGAIPAAAAGLLAACALVLLGVLSIEQAYRHISWTTVILIAGMIPLSTAMVQTGAAQQLADRLVDLVGDGSPHLLIAALVLLTVVLGQLISNTATALIMIPIAISAAGELGVSAKPILMAIAVAAAAAFLTPVATPANLIVMGPGGYRFGDYWKLGLPLLVLFVLAAVLLVPVIWPL